MRTEGRGSFLAEYRTGHDRLHQSFRDQVENTDGTSRADLARAYDTAAACRAAFDALSAPFDAVLTPSTIGAAPPGLAQTGEHLFNAMWTLLHVPCINLPYFQDQAGLPVGLTLTGPRFADRRILAVAASMDRLFDHADTAG
jgi:Asp-tRNA(Asn)/Glu-tRNA(Gln) amidotransferase A subunit family amidase